MADAEIITGILDFPDDRRVMLQPEHENEAFWLAINEPANSPLGSDDLERAARRYHAFGKESGDEVTLSGIRGIWWSGEPFILVLEIDATGNGPTD
jgi:hypothetical protein